MTGQSALKLALLSAVTVLGTACGGGGSSAPAPSTGTNVKPTPVTTTFRTQLSTRNDAADFMALAGFGSSKSQQTQLKDTDAADWLRSQMAVTPTLYLDDLLDIQSRGLVVEKENNRALFWDAMAGSPDQLRQRMVFALSQIVVVSDQEVDEGLPMGYYMDILSRNAFGNYRALLEEVTYSPAMADYLTYLRNKKGDESKGRAPDENYAREIMQLFTIGLVELNMDGTPKLDGNGATIETYSNEDVVGLARVFTGLGLAGGDFRAKDDNLKYQPLQAYVDEHSPLEKSFLGHTIPAGTGPEASIDAALDHLFAHPNVAPFISRQLIQRFTASDPSPAYVERVATAFDNGSYTAPNGEIFGTGERGDLAATIAAILLDDDIMTENGVMLPEKVREPALRFAHFARAFRVANINSLNEKHLIKAHKLDRLTQQPFSSPSVFNFYRPGYLAPATATGDSGMTAPEFQIVNDASHSGYVNVMSEFALDRSSRYNESVNTYKPNYNQELDLASDPEALINHLDNLLLAGRMSPQTRERISFVLEEIPIRETEPDASEDRFARVGVAVTMAVTDPAFIVSSGG